MDTEMSLDIKKTMRTKRCTFNKSIDVMLGIDVGNKVIVEKIIFIGYNKKKNEVSATLKTNCTSTKINLGSSEEFRIDTMIDYLYAKYKGLTTGQRRAFRLDKSTSMYDHQIAHVYAKLKGLDNDKKKELRRAIKFTGELEYLNTDKINDREYVKAHIEEEINKMVSDNCSFKGGVSIKEAVEMFNVLNEKTHEGD